MDFNVLTLFSGDDEPLKLEFKAPDESPVDLLNAGVQDIQFSVKDDSNRELIYKSLGIGDIVYVTDGTDGLCNIIIDQDDTASLNGVYQYDIQIKISDRISTITKSYINIKEDVNRRTQ
jgi:hypothetical protein